MGDYKDKWGYERNHTDSVHRHRAYHHIYLKDRKKYPLPFEAYEVHHIDGDKNNNRMDNLAVLTPEEHDKAHDTIKAERECAISFGVLPKEMKNRLKILKDKFSKSEKEVLDIFDKYVKEREEELLEEFKEKFSKECEKRGYNEEETEEEWEDEEITKEDMSLSLEDFDEVWDKILKDFKEEKEEKEEEEQERKRREERNEKIKQNIKKGFKSIISKFLRKEFYMPKL